MDGRPERWMRSRRWKWWKVDSWERKAGFGLWTDESQRIGRLSQTKKGQRNQSMWTEDCQEFADTTRTTTREPPVLLSVRQIGRDRQDVGR